MAEIKLKKRLPNLSPEEEQIFTEAINEAYLRGKEDGKPKWIPVTERLPKPYMDVITLRHDLFSEKDHAVGLEYITLHGDANIPTWSKDHMTWKTKVTHWMPLPEPPQGE